MLGDYLQEANPTEKCSDDRLDTYNFVNQVCVIENLNTWSAVYS